MSLDVQKTFQNIELKVRGRTAIVVCGFGVLGFTFWDVLRDFALHPLFSVIFSAGIFASMLILIGFGLWGRTRPEEVPPKSVFSVDRMDTSIFVAQGIGSQKELLQLLRQTIRRLPTPSAQVNGSARNEKDYAPLTPSQADAVVAKIEEGINAQLLSAAGQAGSQAQPQLTEFGSDQGTIAKGRTDLARE